MKVDGLSVVIPALNEEDGIGSTLDDVDATLKGVVEYEIVVVDDGSTDRTGKIAAAKARVIRHERNRGYGAAIKTGIKSAKYGTICLLDADSTYPPKDIPRLLEAYGGDRCIVSGARFLGKNVGMPWIREVGNTFFYNLASLLNGRRIHDISSGMKVFSKKTFDELQPLPDTLDMMLVITIRAIKKGMTFKELPIDYHDRKGASKLHALRDGLRFLRSIVKTSITG
jgi:glycosyltransferase involved in cell wall biosynthesis